MVGDDTGMLFARHWGLMAACFGALLIFAAARPHFHKPIVLAALVEKLGLVALIVMAWNAPALAGLHVAALFDGACVLIYGAYLYRARNAYPVSVCSIHPCSSVSQVPDLNRKDQHEYGYPPAISQLTGRVGERFEVSPQGVRLTVALDFHSVVHFAGNNGEHLCTPT